jgi:DNA-binding HxlR family transcriptional regulator
VKRTPFAEWPCPIARAVDIVGDWWTPLVLRDMFRGLRRFDQFEASLRIGRNVLTQRLNRLVSEGLVERVPYQSRPVRYEYLLTEMGRDFLPVLAALYQWGDKWTSSPVVEESSPDGQATGRG